jgi:signal transduction histidine kinase
MAYAILAYLPLVWRRRSPIPVYVAVLASSVLAWIVVPGYVPTLNVWLGLYTVAARCELRWAVLGLVAAFVPTGLNVADEVRRQAPIDRAGAFVVATVLGIMADVVIFAIGRWVAWSVRQRRLVAERAAEDAVAAERDRIARDLHDVVAHAVTLMVLQSGGAARVLRSDPQRAELALRHVDTLGQQAITELRRLLGLLATHPAGADDAAALPSGLADLGALVQRATADDLRVELDVVGEPMPLDPGVSLSAYRIVQEALTNAGKYADRRHPVRVQVNWRQDEVEISVRNRRADTRRAATRALSSGRGLIGIRERARAAGGQVETESLADGGFLVRVTLPGGIVPSPEIPPGDAPERLASLPLRGDSHGG